MDFIKNNFELISLVLFIVLIALMVIFLIYISHVSKFFSSRKFKILGLNELDVLNDETKFVIRIFNNNVNNTIIVGFGFKYKEQTIDFYNQYYKEKNLDKEDPLTIISREYFTFEITTRQLEEIILNIDKEQKSIATLYAYVIDSQGALIKSKAHTVREVISKKLKAILKAKKEEQIALRKAELARIKKIEEEKSAIKKREFKLQKAEKKAKRKENRLNRIDKRKAKIQRFKMKFKDLFTKKHNPKKEEQIALRKAELARLKKIKQDKRTIKKEENKVIKAEKKAKRKENRLNRRDKRKAKRQRFKMKFKDLFTKKPKNKE